ncbi:hypothetical protein KXW97_008955, partial [Aspergillus fumigatus]
IMANFDCYFPFLCGPLTQALRVLYDWNESRVFRTSPPSFAPTVVAHTSTTMPASQ